MTGRRCFCIFLFLLTALAAVFLFCLSAGTVKITLPEIFSLLTSQPDSPQAHILTAIRLPRILACAITGAALSVSGALLQGVMRNPLASPGIIGVSAGGGLAGIIVMLCFPKTAGYLLVPVSFTGALAAVMTVWVLSWKQGTGPGRLILAGAAVSAMLGACSAAVMIFHPDQAGHVLDFSAGSLSACSWEKLRQTLPYMAAGLFLAQLQSARLNVLALGDETASSLGLNTERTRFFLIGTAALLAAGAVSTAGLLGFVGLIAPHIMRMFLGPDNRRLLPCAALAGAILVMLCDCIGRIVIPPREIPAGLLLAMLGPPFFLWLLRKVKYES